MSICWVNTHTRRAYVMNETAALVLTVTYWGTMKQETIKTGVIQPKHIIWVSSASVLNRSISLTWSLKHRNSMFKKIQQK